MGGFNRTFEGMVFMALWFGNYDLCGFRFLVDVLSFLYGTISDFRLFMAF